MATEARQCERRIHDMNWSDARQFEALEHSTHWLVALCILGMRRGVGVRRQQQRVDLRLYYQ